MDELKERLHEFLFVSCPTASDGMIDEAVNEFFHYLETNGYSLVQGPYMKVTPDTVNSWSIGGVSFTPSDTHTKAGLEP